ncbi:MAG TPA: OsmC family protein [Bryobacteraceae bacterium]|jgi:putative redox protein
MKNTHATVHYAGNDFFLAVSPSGHAVPVDMDGQRSAAAGPLELLMLSLGACTGADVISIMKKKRQAVTDYKVEIRGERREEHPRSYRKLELRHVLRGRGISKEAVEQAVRLSTDKYCSVAATLRPTAEIVSTWEIVEEEGAAG